MAPSRFSPVPKKLLPSDGNLFICHFDLHAGEGGEVSMEDGTSFSGNSNNVYGGGGGGPGVGAVGGGVGGVVAGEREHLMMSSSSSAPIPNNSNSNCHINQTDSATNNRLMFTIGSYEDSSFFPILNRSFSLNRLSSNNITL